MKIKYLLGTVLIVGIIFGCKHLDAFGTNNGDSVFSPKFLSKLTSCTPYTETIEPMAGVKITNKVGGKINGKCKLIYMDNTTCYLTSSQIKTITDGAKGIGPSSYTSEEDGARMTIHSDPLSIALTILTNDPSVCTQTEK